MRAALTFAMLTTVFLAGCTGDGPNVASDPCDSPETATQELCGVADDKGGLAGLLIDDAFRPLHLVASEDDAGGAYAVVGFLLIHETGQQIRTNVDGEFLVNDLEPGRYTIRGTVAGHEVTQHSVNVEAGSFTEAAIEARRVANTDGLVVTEEFAIFISCNAYATFDCTFDQSGDSNRPGIRGNFSNYNDTVTYSTWEVKLNNPHIFCFEVREDSVTGASLDRHFGNWCEGQDSTYLKGILQKNETYAQTNRDPWDPTALTEAILFTFGNTEATCWMYPGSGGIEGTPTHNPDDRYRCAGVSVAIKAQIVVSFFLSEPAVDIEEYCLFCD